ncbi:Glyco_transf_90 domain-containing protein [Cephalotus follicularis]|uniref:Glyco_transf_90 domain-containing protein n=1 Tax=Cephalotus follicularis TaxID=3775 RepID=A0A1Q3D788_CEPFO|nr:Glyco_transf_90 domain-containing protein [Cephalotus follicularis]
MATTGESERSMKQRVSGLCSHLTETIWRPLMTSPATTPALFLLFFLLVVGALFSTGLLDRTTIAGISALKSVTTKTTPTDTSIIPKIPPKKKEIPPNCTPLNMTSTYPTKNSTANQEDLNGTSPATCPEYFRWIHEDLKAWAHTGISRELVERTKARADFRLVIVDGQAYMERYHKSFQTRDVFTLWGILQLLRKYPGKLPDLDLMFDCNDRPATQSNYYNGPHAPAPLPLFRYCSVDDSVYLLFPDWSFWGWPEINIKPWKPLLEDIKVGNNRIRWMEREPHAYWKGNPDYIGGRQELLKCNVTKHQDWNARVYIQDWRKETQEGFKQSDLASQCTHRYKIYIEGIGWSVSEKYILACDSITLFVKPHYYDFFTRGLVPLHHYWPIKADDKCKSIKFAVDWGNHNEQKAQAIGKAASEFTQNDLKMDYVYDYMLHLLTEYAKLLTFKPTIPQNAVAISSETMICEANGLEKKFMMESMEKGPAEASPCVIPPPFDPPSLYGNLSRNKNSIKQVELWQKNYWDSQNKHS